MSTKPLPSCAGCRLRRVKCVRQDGLTGACLQCTRKGIVCALPDKQARKPYKPREGHIIQAAKELCGAEPASSQQWLVAANDRVARMEESDAFLASLVDAYYESVFFAAPSARWKVLRKQFDLAGRRPSQVQDPTSNLLIRAVVVYGALVSACPALVGQDAPRPSQIHNFKGADLSLYGQRRFPIAKRLFDQAITSVDMQGIFRKPSDSSVTILTFIGELTAFFNDDPALSAPYFNASCSMIKEMASQVVNYSPFDGGGGRAEAAVAADSGGSGVTLALMDAYKSATTGMEPSITERQAPWHFGPIVPRAAAAAPISESTLQTLIFTNDTSALAQPMCSMWYRVFQLLRKIGSDVARPIREQHIFPVEGLRAVLEDLDNLRSWLDTSQQTMHISPLALTYINRLDHFEDMRPDSHLAAGQVFLDNVTRVIERHVHDFKAYLLNRRFSQMDQEDDLQNQISSLDRRLSEKLLLAARHVARETAARSLLDMLRIDSATGLLGDHTSYWAKSLLSLPCDVEGGPSYWTLADKIKEITALVDFTRIRSWTWPSRAQEANEVANLLAAFKSVWQPPLLPSIPSSTFASLPEQQWNGADSFDFEPRTGSSFSLSPSSLSTLSSKATPPPDVPLAPSPASLLHADLFSTEAPSPPFLFQGDFFALPSSFDPLPTAEDPTAELAAMLGLTQDGL